MFWNIRVHKQTQSTSTPQTAPVRFRPVLRVCAGTAFDAPKKKKKKKEIGSMMMVERFRPLELEVLDAGGVLGTVGRRL